MSNQNIAAIYELTPLQEGILYHTLESDNPGVYFEQITCVLDGALQHVEFETAWKIVVDRHSALRTFFSWERRDKPLQVVRHKVDLPWFNHDWCQHSPAEQDQMLEQFLISDRDRGFALDRAPLLRVALIRLGENRYRMVWSFHHLLIDGWSARLVMKQVLGTYYGLVAGEQPQPDSAPDFEQFVQWLRQQDSGAQEHFWREQLAGFRRPTFPQLGRDQPQLRSDLERGEVRTRELEVAVDDTCYRQLQDTAKERRLTLNSLAVAAWSIVLARYCEADDVVFGTTFAGRPVEIENVGDAVGLYINTLPMRVRFSHEDTIGEVLERVQAGQLSMQAFAHSPLNMVQKWSDLPVATHLFESILVFENLLDVSQGVGAAGEHDLTISEQRYIEYSNFPFALLVVPERELKVIAVYDSARVSEADAGRLLGAFCNTLAELTLPPDTLVRDVTVLSVDEQRTLLQIWNDTATDLGEAIPLHRMFERCVENEPQRTALIAAGQSLSYGMFNRRCNQLAHALRSRHIAPGALVVVYAHRGIDALTAMFAVLKAGAAYVPMDPALPLQRLEQVLDDLAAASHAAYSKPLVLVPEALSGNISPDLANCMLIDADYGDYPDTNIDGPDDSSCLAYVIYTSGSTGTPKGVMISHDNLYNSTMARESYYQNPVDTFLLLSSLATDSSIAGIYWTLCTGGTLLLAEGRAEQDVGSLGRLIREHRATHMLCVPSLYALILQNAELSDLGSLRAVIVAGEACTSSLVRQHGIGLAQASMYNEYGPSEACVWATVEELGRTGEDVSVTIGRPVANTTCYVLDKHLNPVPLGVAGELYIGGKNVAAGYLNDVNKTESVFFADRFSALPGARLYKTGDRVRYLSDGRLEFLGRVDHQLKVRGFRVEPGEIESALTSHSQVQEAIAFVDEVYADDAIIVACQELDEDVVRGLLDEVVQAGLPEKTPEDDRAGGERNL